MTNLELELAKSALWLERYSPLVLAEIETKLLIAQKQILALISETQNKSVIRSEIKKIMSESFSTFDTIIADDIQEITELAYNSTNVIMTSYVTNELAEKAKEFKNINKSIKAKLNNPNRLIQGHTAVEHFSHIERQSVMKMQGIIFKGFDEGAGVESISRDIRNTIGSVNRNQVKTIVRTSLLESSHEAQQESLSFFNNAIISWTYSSVIDGRTSKTCLMMSGVTHKNKSDFKIRPKNHFSCRSMLIPNTELTKELKQDSKIVQWDKRTINHRDGTTSTGFKVDKIKSIPTGLKGNKAFDYFDEDYKKEYLGATRYKLYKDGKATLKDMIDVSRNKFVSLDKLKSKISK